MGDGILLFLDSNVCLTTAATYGKAVILSGCLIAKSVNKKYKSSHATNDIMGQIREHIFEKSVRRPHHQGPGCRWSAPLVVAQLFIIALSRVGTGDNAR